MTPGQQPPNHEAHLPAWAGWFGPLPCPSLFLPAAYDKYSSFLRIRKPLSPRCYSTIVNETFLRFIQLAYFSMDTINFLRSWSTAE
jgi:hypothetical protein